MITDFASPFQLASRVNYFFIYLFYFSKEITNMYLVFFVRKLRISLAFLLCNNYINLVSTESTPTLSSIPYEFYLNHFAVYRKYLNYLNIGVLQIISLKQSQLYLGDFSQVFHKFSKTKFILNYGQIVEFSVTFFFASLLLSDII